MGGLDLARDLGFLMPGPAFSPCRGRLPWEPRRQPQLVLLTALVRLQKQGSPSESLREARDLPCKDTETRAKGGPQMVRQVMLERLIGWIKSSGAVLSSSHPI